MGGGGGGLEEEGVKSILLVPSLHFGFKFEPAHDKYYRMACAPSEDFNQPWHLPSLIRVFAVRMKKAWVLGYPLSAQQRF